MEIKPCPFCGGEAEVQYGDFGEVFVACKNNNCGGRLGTSIWFTTYDKAVEVWNTRAPIAQQPQAGSPEGSPKPCAHWKYEGEYGRLGKSDNCYHPDCKKWRTASPSPTAR